MLYKEFIDNILNTRGRFAIPKNEYKERHHIIPKCMGGNNEKDNLIDLYAREHFIAHKLLAEENPHNKSLTYAFWNMCVVSQDRFCRYKPDPREYEKARKMHQDMMSNRVVAQETKDKMREKQMGEHNSFYGKHHTAETRKRLRETHLGDKNSMYGLRGRDNPNAKKIYCVELDRVFGAMNEAAKELNILRECISACCRGKQQTAGGYHWMYLEDYQRENGDNI